MENPLWVLQDFILFFHILNLHFIYEVILYIFFFQYIIILLITFNLDI